MARSTYVYVVTDATGTPVAAFTVKHELATWLDRNPRTWWITRVRDGVDPGEPTALRIADVKASVKR